MGIGEFAARAVRQAGTPAWRSILLTLFVLLAVTNYVLATHAPAPGGKPDAAFGAAGAIRAIALFSISAALLRIAADSPRKRWAFDGGFWLYLAISLIEFVLTAGATIALKPLSEPVQIIGVHAVSVLAMVPLSVWMVAAAVEQPLAAAPGPWFQRAGEWMPPLFATMLAAVVIAALHGWLSLRLLETAGTPSFWPLLIVDALLATLLVTVALSLRLTAWRIAKGDPAR